MGLCASCDNDEISETYFNARHNNHCYDSKPLRHHQSCNDIYYTYEQPKCQSTYHQYYVIPTIPKYDNPPYNPNSNDFY